MTPYVALLRGINVGGKNKLPMKDLVAILEDLGCESVTTYIQSGNVAFRCKKKPKLAEAIGAAIRKRHGFAPEVMLLDGAQLRKAVRDNPFPTKDGKALHFYFLDSRPKKPDLDRLTAVKARSERFELKNAVFYLHAPDGIGRSKLATMVERSLGVAATARNWNTVAKLLEMIEAV